MFNFLIAANYGSLISTSDQLRPFLDESAGGFVECLFEALEESRNSRGNKGAGEKHRKRDLKVSKQSQTSTGHLCIASTY